MPSTLFNQFDVLPYIPYNIVKHLAQDPKAEDFWKLLKYTTYDALSQPNLSLQEKLSLIWVGEGFQNNHSIFFTRLIEDEQTIERTVLKLYKYDVSPNNAQQAIASYEFDILTGGKTVIVDYNGVPASRIDVAETALLQSLNGIDVAGVGYLQFNKDLSRLDRMTHGIGNNTTYIGDALFMSLMVSNLSDTRC